MLVIPMEEMDEERREKIRGLAKKLEALEMEIANAKIKYETKSAAAKARWAKQRAVSQGG